MTSILLALEAISHQLQEFCSILYTQYTCEFLDLQPHSASWPHVYLLLSRFISPLRSAKVQQASHNTFNS